MGQVSKKEVGWLSINYAFIGGHVVWSHIDHLLLAIFMVSNDE